MIAFLIGDSFLLEQFTHIIVVEVDGGHHDMGWFLTLQLDDALAQVGLHDFNATLLQIGVHLTLLGEHGFGLHHLLHVMVLQNAIYYLVELLGILCPMYLHTILLGIGGKLVKVFVQMGNGVALNGRSLLAQLFPLIQSVCHIISLRSYCPERGIMPVGILLIL